MRTFKRIAAALDRAAGIELTNPLVVWLERAAFIFVVIMIFTSPHSIAASQSGWVLGFIFFIGSVAARLLTGNRLKLDPTFLALPLLAYFGWTVLTVFTSYAPDISAGKLPSAALFTVFFLVANVVRTRSGLKFLAFGIIVSCMVSVVWMPLERIPGRGVEIHNVEEQGALWRIGLRDGDTLLEVNGKKIGDPEEIVAELNGSGKGKVRFYRPDFYEQFEISKADLSSDADPGKALGFSEWRSSRNWRSSGFFSMYATYSEVLVLIGSLVAGLFAAGLLLRLRRRNREEGDPEESSAPDKWLIAALGVSIALIGIALILTQTRASQGSFALALLLISFLSLGRKGAVLVLIALVPAAAIGLYALQSSRNISYVDSSDSSTSWRVTVYREAIGLWSASVRNAVFGVGMDSRKRFEDEWGLFDEGKLFRGHFHSTPLQLLVEKGLPALLLWLWVLFRYFRRCLKATRQGRFGSWWEHGILLGGLAGVFGFFTSGFVHYNLGDSEVQMVLYILMGFAVLTIQRYELEPG